MGRKSDRQKAREVLAAGSMYYVPARPCAKCGTSKRYASNRNCVQCVADKEALNKDKRAEYNKRYYAEHKEEMSAYKKQWRQENIERRKAKDMAYHYANKERRNRQSKERYREAMATPEGRERMRAYYRKYYTTDKARAARRKYEKDRRAKDIQFRLACSLRTQMSHYLDRSSKNGRMRRLIGCDLEFFKGYIAAQFKYGMSWSNYGEWELDHKTPVTWFDQTNAEQRKICWHYTNYQPMWQRDNVRKGNRWAGAEKPSKIETES